MAVKIHRIQITKNLNQVGICALEVSGIADVSLGQRFSITANAGDIPFTSFSGIVTKKETKPNGLGTVTLSDDLGEDRDDETITQSVVWFEPKMDGNCISVELKYGTSPVRFLDFSSAEREINFANASKLQILQQYCEEFGKTFNPQGLFTGGTFSFSKFEDYKITEKKKANAEDLAVQVSYLRQYPLIQQTEDTEDSVQELSTWIGDPYTANIHTVVQKINDVEVYRKSTYSPTRGGTIYNETIKTVSQVGSGYTVRTKQTVYYNQLKNGILHNITLGGKSWSFDVLAHYDNDEGKWLDYVTVAAGGFIYDGQKNEWNDTDITLDQTDKNGKYLESGQAYYAKIFINYLSGQIYALKGERDTNPSTLTIDSYLQSWQLAIVRVSYTDGNSEISTSDITIDWQGFPWGGFDDPHYKYFETIEICDSALRVSERTYTVKDDEKTVYSKEETWSNEIYRLVEKQEDKNGNLAIINQTTRGFSSMPTAAAPKAEIVSEEGYAVYGNGDKYIEVSSSFLSNAQDAAAYAERLYKKEVESKEGWIQFINLIPTAEPGQYYSNSDIFEGSIFIEQVIHTIDFDAATAITEISGSIV